MITDELDIWAAKAADKLIEDLGFAAPEMAEIHIKRRMSDLAWEVYDKMTDSDEQS